VKAVLEVDPEKVGLNRYLRVIIVGCDTGHRRDGRGFIGKQEDTIVAY
jgi:hypothetical protein